MGTIKDILNALWLILLMVIWVLAGTGTGYTGLALNALFPNGFFLIAAGFLITFPLPVVIFAYIHYFLWGKADTNKPQWIASNASMHEATWQWFIGVVASIAALIMFALLTAVTGGTLNPEPSTPPNEAILLKKPNLTTAIVRASPHCQSQGLGGTELNHP